MRVLGVDPGLTRCGLGVVQGSLGRPLAMAHVEVVTTPPSETLPERLLVISQRVAELIRSTAPDVVAVERVFSQHNVQTVMGTAQASAAAVLATAEAGLPVAWHTPSEVKAAVTGTGRADKAAVSGMVMRILGLPQAPRPVDATDALALAICHVWRGTATSRIDAAIAGSPPSRIPRSPATAPAARRAPGPRQPGMLGPVLGSRRVGPR